MPGARIVPGGGWPGARRGRRDPSAEASLAPWASTSLVFGVASSFNELSGSGWPRLLATGVAKRREVQPGRPGGPPRAAAPPRLRATAATPAGASRLRQRIGDSPYEPLDTAGGL